MMANKKNNSAKYIKIVVALVLIIAAAFGIYYMFFENYRIVGKDNTADTVNNTVSDSSVSVSSSAKKDMQSTVSESETQSKPEESKAETAKQEKNYNLPLSINQAMNALEDKYGAEYDVNSTIEEDGINYFAVYKNDEKYASVAVNLMTGEATETIMETNQKTDFYLV